jgi:hypothetical protein
MDPLAREPTKPQDYYYKIPLTNGKFDILKTTNGDLDKNRGSKWIKIDQAEYTRLLSEKKGGRRHTRKWIQGVVSKLKTGSFTREALRHHMTPSKYADAVLKHPKKHTLRTRRRALFLRNIRHTRRH